MLGLDWIAATPDSGLDAAGVAVALAGLFVAGVVKGATGLGYATCALPFLAVSLGLKPAMAAVVLPAMATNINLVFTGGHAREMLARFRWLYLAMLPGIAVGLALLSAVDQSLALQALGATIIAYAVFAWFTPKLALPARLEGPLQVPTGFLNGVVTGLTGSQVMPLFPYVMALALPPAAVVQAINLAVLIASLVLSVGLATTGILTEWLFVLSAAAIVPALFGTHLGMWARTRIPAAAVRRVMLVALIAMGVLALTR